jgi:hypothetical protein
MTNLDALLKDNNLNGLAVVATIDKDGKMHMNAATHKISAVEAAGLCALLQKGIMDAHEADDSMKVGFDSDNPST